MNIPKTGEIRNYYIAFTDDARLNWFYKLFTRKGFRHCEIFMSIENKTLGICHKLENIEVMIHDMTITETIKLLKEKGFTILYLPVEIKPRKIRLGVFIPSCVGSCQVITGVSFNSIGVYSYYRKLLKNGARPIN